MKEKHFILLCKIFCIGLILQFFVYTFVTFQLKLDGLIMDIIWLWKEIFVIIGGMYAAWSIWKKRLRHNSGMIWTVTLVFVGLMIYALVDTLMKGLSISWFIKAWKYDFIGYMIFLIAYYLSVICQKETLTRFVQWFLSIIKSLLIWALVRYTILLLKPGVLKLFGYDRMSIEGEVGKRPPAVYRTREFEGLPRNQFLFERPISRGFFLAAFFPLFFIQFLQRKSRKKTWFRRIVYALNIIVTYSRAAWGSWIVELGLLGFITYRKQISMFLKKIFIPAIICLAGIAFIAKDQVINREFSNTGHVQLLVQGRGYFKDHWLIGMGAGSVGPASHWNGGLSFNPENQYLQIAIEFGLIGFLAWIFIYARLHYIGYKRLRLHRKEKNITLEDWYLIAFSIGMLGLSISGLVLHSFTDRMIVYPFMVVGGIIYHISTRPTTRKR